MCEVAALIRRCIDIVFSAVALIGLSPLFLIVAVAILADSRGSVVYRSRRVGKDGRLFHILKFRSMVADADQRGPAVTSRGDCRITRVGSFLRGTKLDELPQFWNVLKGDMTLFGPRPEAPEFVEFYSPDQRSILSEKPGLTGPSQISCNIYDSMAVLDSQAAEYYIKHVLARRLAIDAEYLRTRSAMNDLILVGRTLGLMCRALWRGIA